MYYMHSMRATVLFLFYGLYTAESQNCSSAVHDVINEKLSFFGCCAPLRSLGLGVATWLIGSNDNHVLPAHKGKKMSLTNP